jgi:hypothetical protein
MARAHRCILQVGVLTVPLATTEGTTVSTQKYTTAGAPTPTAEAVNDTSAPPHTAGVSTHSTRGQYVEHPRVLSRCTHVPALRCAADDSAADSAKPSHAVTAQPHRSVSAEAEPSTDPDERTPQPGPAPAGSRGRRRSTCGDNGGGCPCRRRRRLCRPFLPSLPRTHSAA